MSVSLYFGLPGCGKTTYLTYLALQGVKSKKYKYVYHTVKELSVPGAFYIDIECIGKYRLADCLLLIDEATLFADSRSWKTLDKKVLQYFLLHRHFHCDICLFTQQWDGVDRKIRVITDRCYYLDKSILFGRWFTRVYKIPYGIIIPDPYSKGNGNGEKLGEIIQGYCKPHPLMRLFCKRIFRPRFYKYFDSFAEIPLPPLPPRYVV